MLNRITRTTLLFLATLLCACGADTDDSTSEIVEEPVVVGPALRPLPGMEDRVPALTIRTVILMRTDAGNLTIEIYPEAAPNAAARFLELVEADFYDNTPIFRVVPGFVSQFGINWRDDYPLWQDNNFDDDPSLFALERGTLAFAKAGPNTNSTQVFINYEENNRLAAPNLNFSVFGKVVLGMETADAFIPVGDPGGGLDQERLWNDGGAYLESLDTSPVMIEEATILATEFLP